MANYPIKYIEDENGNRILPVTHLAAVKDSNGNNLETILGTIAYINATPTTLNGSKSINVVNLDADVSNIKFTTAIPTNAQCTVIFTSTATRNIIIPKTLASESLVASIITPYNTSINLTLTANGYSEVNFFNINGTVYARGL